MAIEKNIPSPEEIKKSPSKFTSEELNEIKQLQDKISELTYRFGQIYLNRLKLQENEEILKKEIKSLETKEIQLAKKLSSKYGKGQLNIDTGEFKPNS